MNLNATPSSHRVHIGFFGRTNSGKSSLVNAITNQQLAIVSDTKGTTTDPVSKAMELLPIGPVVIVDTPGLDDTGNLGNLRKERTKKIFSSIDIGVLVLDAERLFPLSDTELDIIKEFENRNLPFVITINKEDLITDKEKFKKLPEELAACEKHVLWVSAKNKTGIEKLKEHFGTLQQKTETHRPFICDRLSPLDSVILVIPIDEGAPKGRIILPQQQVLRELLENGIVTTVVRETELAEALNRTHPRAVITDSQVFDKVSPIVPSDIYLTSFSILMARYKGNLAQAVRGAKTIDSLESGAHILISEGCTHHRQCNDIGTVKLPKWIKLHTDKEFHLEWSSGNEFPENLTNYDLIIHCGGCMLNDREMQSRYEKAFKDRVPITNYGIFIAHLRGILERSTDIFGESL